MKTSSCRIFVCICACAVLLALYFGCPEGESWWLQCPLYRFFGWQCPFCGSQRAVHAFLHGQWADAWRYNPALWLSAPYGLLLLAGQCSCRCRGWRLVRWCYRDSVMASFLLLAVGWAVARTWWL